MRRRNARFSLRSDLVGAALRVALRGFPIVPLAAVVSGPTSALAWDPGETHQGITDAALRTSALHRRWMSSTELSRGIFSPLRVSPALLSPEELRIIDAARRATPADNMAVPLGGPGACPGPEAPPETQRYCVEGDAYEATAIGWIRLGLVAEVTPATRLASHFLDREDPSATQWSDRELPGGVLRRRQVRANGATRAAGWAGTAFGGTHPSAVAWLERGDDPLAPPRLFHHLEQASMAAEPRRREHHLAMALMATGALLHVLQDASVPAHARGDASAFSKPLSESRGDRGLPLQEFARVHYGRRGLPTGDEAAPPAEGVPLAPSLAAHLLGTGATGDYEGIARLAGDRFFSESSLPPPVPIAPTASPTEAATQLMGTTRLDPVERHGAYLAPWPADSGYLFTGTGRVLSAWSYDGRGRIEPFLDEVVYREQIAALVPAAVAVSRSALDLLWPAWPGPVAQQGPLFELEVPDTLASAELLVMEQDAAGHRTLRARTPLEPGRSHRVVGLPTVDAAGARLVLALRGIRLDGGDAFIVEQTMRPIRGPRSEAESTGSAPPQRPAAPDPATGPPEAAPTGGDAPTEPKPPATDPAAPTPVEPAGDAPPDPDDRLEPGGLSPASEGG